MKKGKRFDFISIFLDFIIAILLAGLAVFIYLCFNYGVETTVTEFADNLDITKIVSAEEEKTSIELPTVENPLAATEIVETSQESVKNNKSGYHYTQIDESAKIIYDELLKNEKNLRKGNYKIDFGTKFNDLLNKENGSEKLNSSYQQALDAFSLDNPQVFYLDISKMMLMIYSKKTIFKTTYNVSIESEEGDNYFSEGFHSEEEVNAMVTRMENIRNDLYSKLEGSDYKKIKDVHDCLVNSLDYEETVSKSNIRNIYGALITREVVCEGYAKAFKYLLDGLDIPNIIVVGIATNSEGKTESHAWSYVCVGEKWYAVDVTWDDPIIIGNGKLPEKEKYRYFLKGSNSIEENHVATGQISDKGMKFLYPKLSTSDYR